jgi:hypothetical protein
MKKRFPIVTILFLAICYVGFGDQVLPRSVGKYSTQTRAAIDDMMIGAFPGFSSKTRPNARTEDAVRQTESR